MDTSVSVYHIVEGGGNMPFYLKGAKAIVRTVMGSASGSASLASALSAPPPEARICCPGCQQILCS